MSRGPGINLIGYATANLGLGVTLRSFANALINRGHDVALFDMDAGSGRSGFDMSLQAHLVPAFDDLPHPINVWMLGADHIAVVASQICGSAKLKGQFNVMFLWWELPHIPPLWLEAAQAFDALITGSAFVQHTWANQVSCLPVLLAASPLDMPPDVAPNRSRFGLPEGPVLYYTGFEAASDPSRKNPFAAVEAFKSAFPATDDVGLVIKVNNPGVPSRMAQAQLSRLKSMTDGDTRVQMVNERLSYPDLLSLYASCDVFLSLHRSEGLGLIPLEAMRLGKVIVATGWSGNLSYMNQCNAALVGYRMVDVDERSYHYCAANIGIQSRWAEPDVDHAARWMKELASNSALRASLCAAAVKDSLAFDEKARLVGFADELTVLFRSHQAKSAADYSRVAARIREAVWAQRAAKRGHALAKRGLLSRVARGIYGNLYDALDKRILWRFQ